METVVATRVHHVTTVHGASQHVHRALAACPRRHESVSFDACASCPHARGVVEGTRDADRRVLCAVERDVDVGAQPGSVGASMRRDVVCVRPDVALDDVVMLFIERDIGGVPVVDDGDAPIGMLSKSDIVQAYARGGAARQTRLDTFDPCFERVASKATAGDVMSGAVFALREGESLARAAELFACEHIHRAPVVDRAGRVVGVLTSFDIVRAIAGAP